MSNQIETVNISSHFNIFLILTYSKNFWKVKNIYTIFTLFVTTNDCCRFLFPVAVLPNARPGKLS